MKNFNKKELALAIFGFLFFSALAVFVVYSMFFLSIRINDVLDIKTDKEQMTKINFEGLKKIGIMK